LDPLMSRRIRGGRFEPSFVLGMTMDGRVTYKNQTAHEVTRDVTAWAYQFAFRKPPRASTLRSSFCVPTSGLGPMLSASSSRPGPASARSAWAWPFGVAHTDGFPRFVFAVAHPIGVAKRFPDWTAVGFRSRSQARYPARRLRDLPNPLFYDLPDPVPRIASPLPHLQCSSGPLGPMTR
jgi:hypothetical protein